MQLFFVLSGYLVTTLLLRERDEGELALGRFFARRALRIFPLYYLVLALVAAHTLASSPSPSRSHFLESFWYYATYTSNWWVDWDVSHPIVFGFAWTLAIEEQFYVLWPPVLRFVRQHWLQLAFAIGMLLSSELVTWPALQGAFPEGSFFRTFCLGLSSSIALGCLLAWALHQRAAFGALLPIFGSRAAAPFAALLSLWALARDAHHLVFHGALCLWVGACVVRPDHGLAWLLNRRGLLYVGRSSYALYLTHFMAIGLVRRLYADARPVWTFALALPIALGIAELSYHFVESPFLRLKRRLGSRTGGATPLPSPAASG